jgi:Fe-S oxidoreductase
LLYRSIGLATVALLLASGTGVVLPPKHLCCGYPLLAAGCKDAYSRNQEWVRNQIKEQIDYAQARGLEVKRIITACGTCREALSDYDLRPLLHHPGQHQDALQFVLERLPGVQTSLAELVYHVSCHVEFSGAEDEKAGDAYAAALGAHLGLPVRQSPGCCGESGLGALTSPEIYNTIRERKYRQLRSDLSDYPDQAPIVVGCPSCKAGLSRIMGQNGWKQRVLHGMELLAQEHWGRAWLRQVLPSLKKGNIDGRGRRRASIGPKR